jgi:hypothetical protein
MLPRMRLAFLLLTIVTSSAAQSQAVLAALATGTYFPLDVGDRWVYREDIRVQTASYQTWRVDRTETVNGKTYSAMAIEGPGSFYAEQWFRADSSGAVYLYTGSGEVLFMAAGQVTASAGNQYQVQLQGSAGPVATALGTFPDAMAYVNYEGLDIERGTLARGIGLVTSTTIMDTGSSGGDTLIRTLVEAHLAGGIDFPALQSSIELGLESLSLNVSGMQVTNCAIPCYFVACYIAFADPPGTYKPCAQARIALKNWPSQLSRAVTLQLLAPGGSSAFRQSLTLDAAPSASVTFIQVPLYSAPNVPLPPGAYQLTAVTAGGAAQSMLTVTIQ